MTNVGSLPDLSSWVTLRGNRPPRALDLLFWGAVLITVSMLGVALITEGLEEIRQADPVLIGYVMSSAVGLTLSCVLWPFLPWTPRASGRDRSATLAFLLLSLGTMFLSNHTMFLIGCVAAMNAMAVFGTAGLLGYSASLTVFSLVAIILSGEHPLIGAALAMGLGLMTLLSGLVYVGLVLSAQRAERTRELLAELEEAHAELRSA